MATVNWGTSSLNFAGTQRVYIRQRWADAWILQPSLWCEQCAWSLLPSLPTARLVRYYGRGLQHAALNVSDASRVDIRGYYVRIEFDCPDGTLSWFGFVDEQVDEQGGNSSGVPTGKQQFVCFSMVQMLAHQFMTYSRWFDEPNAVLRTSGSSITFNQLGLPNRTNVVKTGADSHVFYPRLPKNQIQFPHAWDNASYWTSRDIIDYIENYLVPTDKDGVTRIPVRFDNKSLVPDWDRPTIQTEGRSVLSLIEQLINPSRLMQISVGQDGQTVVLNIHSLASTGLTLPVAGKTHAANSQPLSIVCTNAQDTALTIRSSTTRLAHQIVVKGAKRQSCDTVTISKSGDPNISALAEGWSSADTIDYNAAASGEVGYGALTTTQKQALNAAVRGKEELDDVYKTFVLHSDWDREWNLLPKRWAFQEDNPAYDPNNPSSDRFIEYHPFWNSIKILPVLPFKEGYDYTGATPPAGADDAETQWRPPYVLFQHPDHGYFLQAEKMSNGENPSFSVGVGIAKEGLGVRLDVLGSYQHSIADFRFTALPDDPTVVGEWDYFDSTLTLAFEEDRYAEARYPADSALTTNSDVIRQKVLYAGEAYRQVRVRTATTVTVDNDGNPVQTQAGLTDTDDYLVDDSDKLAALALMAASWYLVDRKVVTLVSARPSAVPAVGQLMVLANGDLINSIVTQISISVPLGESGPAGLQYELQTALGELDVLQFTPPLQRNQN